jgi:hypothetical protein
VFNIPFVMLSTFMLFSVNSTKHLYSPVVYTTIDSSLRSELQIFNRLRSFNCVIWVYMVSGLVLPVSISLNFETGTEMTMPPF